LPGKRREMANVVLVHGAWYDGSSWSQAIPLHQEAGHEVITVQNPLTSLADDVANVCATMTHLDRPTVLAGHSYGGTIISGAATDVVTGLVFVTAIANDEGESVNDILGRFPDSDIPRSSG
jgi:pimeloyl-ACP methyl ester carboxylesterase